MSFGFKYGLPLDADHVADVRFLPNPFWVAELRPRTGLDEAVSEYVLAQDGAQEFLDTYAAALQPVLAGYLRENKRYATVAVGCTGGKHRSVAITEALAEPLAVDGRQRHDHPPRPGPGVSRCEPAVVALGGGHGLAASLAALRHLTDRLTAVVTVADDGGSSGRLAARARRAAAGRPADGAVGAVRRQ